MARLTTRILAPSETDCGTHVAVIEGWYVQATDENHAQRIIDTCNMAAAVAEKQAKAEIRKALGLRPYGDHAPY